MNIEKGQHVKYFLRNGMVLEGFVEEDTASQVVLKSLDGGSLMILHRPTEDIMMTKVVLTESFPEEEIEDQTQVVTISDNSQEPVKDKLRDVLQLREDEALQKMSLTELRQLVVEQERQLIANKKREHFGTAGAAKLTQYSTPYVPMRTVGRKVVPRSPYQPGQIPSWAYGRPPKGK